MGLEISLLGSPTVRRDGVVAAPPRGNKAWGLLAFLALGEAPVSRTRVAALLFPDANDPLATTRWNLHELRRLLGADASIHGDPITVRLPPTGVLDVTVLRSGSWHQALLVADPDAELLQGLTFAGCPGFEGWLTAARRHLRSVAEAVLHESVLAQLAAGQTDQALATAARLVGSNPYHEGLQELYVRCLLAAGDLAGARRQRQVAIDLIRRDLGVPVGSGLRTVGQQPVDDGADAEPVDIRAWSNLGLTWLHAGSYDAALALLRKSVAAARRRGDPMLLLRSLLVCGYGLGVSSLGGGAESATVQHEAIALATQLGDERLRGMAELQFAVTELLRGQYSRALHWADRAAARCVVGSLDAARVDTVRGTAIVDTGRYDEGVDVLRTRIDSVPVDADPRNAAYALSMLGKAHLLAGDLAAAGAALDRAIHLARIHWIGFRPWPEALRAEVALRCGQLERAEQMSQQAYALARNFDHSPCWESAAGRAIGLVAAANGAVDEAVDWFHGAYRRLDQEAVTYEWAHCNALDSLCELAVAHAMPGAPAWLAELAERAGRFGMHGFLNRGIQHSDRLGRQVRESPLRVAVGG
jgi:DNA-binding SARP family transcriptional activator